MGLAVSAGAAVHVDGFLRYIYPSWPHWSGPRNPSHGGPPTGWVVRYRIVDADDSRGTAL